LNKGHLQIIGGNTFYLL